MTELDGGSQPVGVGPTFSRLVGFVGTTQPDVARDFYQKVLGLTLESESDFAIVFATAGTTLRVQKVQSVTPSSATALGWEVEDVRRTVRELTARGVSFEQFNLPYLEQDEHGVWTVPGGPKVAWFKDPDGYLLSISGP